VKIRWFSDYPKLVAELGYLSMFYGFCQLIYKIRFKKAVHAVLEAIPALDC
jgi:hypothetical protein